MKVQLCFLISVCIVTAPAPVLSQKLFPNSTVTGVCYAGNKINRIYIPPPGIFFKKSGIKGGASITVKYTGFSPAPKAAVEYAISILESILPVGTKITISASWEKINTSGVLANSSITGYAYGAGIDAQNPNSVYPVALAEKIAGKDLNDSLESDINLRINSSANWYTSTDGNTPAQMYDLVTVCLHEVCHGLGFFDSMDTDNVIGWYGIDSLPLIYDTFIENLQGKKLTDKLAFKNYSASLLSQMTGGSLYFNGPLLSYYTSGSRARIYAPRTWDSGSSISHLDENFTSEPNTLMTPFIDKGEAIHDPGKFTLSILGDLGWVNTRFIHSPGHDTEVHLNALPLSVKIASDTLYNQELVGAVFSYNNFVTSDTLFMTSPGSDDIYECTLNIPSYNTEVQYYFFTEDCFNRIYRSPSWIDSLKYSLYIGADTVRPVIKHSPLTSFLDKIDSIRVIATVTDNLGVDTVFIEYRLNEGPSAFIGMRPGKDHGYEAEIVTRSMSLNGGDSIQYRIVASDSARIPNSSGQPVSGFYSIHIEDLSTVVETYSTNFTGNAADDFINDGFEIFKPLGFKNFGLNSRHPYESPEDNEKTIQYVSVLRHPVKLNESGMLVTFNEIVLVEPGESGSVFGSDGFYDYVIVEGSKDFGKTWFKLADGYDSRFFKAWETAYNNSNDGTNSTAIGNESMLNKHSILFNPTGEVTVGDTLVLRFRLFSDPFAHGWGWIIEDLKINPLVDAVEPLLSEGEMTVYPNPGNGIIRVRMATDESGNGKLIRYSIYSATGIAAKAGYLQGSAEYIIDISDRPSGIYVIVLYRDDWIKTIKYSLIK
jgi:hypothetical protein